MTTWIKGGWLDGHPVRRARKAHVCNYWWGNGSQHPQGKSGRCHNAINPGDLYVEGERNDTAGGFGADRYCVDCATIESDEARAAVVAEATKPKGQGHA